MRRRRSSEITQREILFSIMIIFVVIALGVLIVSSVQNNMEERNEVYYKAMKIEDETAFNYAQQTDAGNALVYANIKAVDTVEIPEIVGEFMYISRHREDYTRHTRTVTTTDSNGKTRTKTEVYYTWDYKGSDVNKNQQLEIFNNRYLTSKFSLSSMTNNLKVTQDNFNPTTKYRSLRMGYIYQDSNTRYYYTYVPIEITGNLLVKFSNNTINYVEGSSIEINKGNLDERIEQLEKSVGTTGTLMWISISVVTAIGIVYFVKGDHHWLERG